MANTLIENRADVTPAGVGRDPIYDSEPYFDILDILIVLKREQRKVFLVAAVPVILGILIVFLLRDTYKATAIILPPAQAQSLQSAFLGQLGSLSALGGGASSLLKNPGDMYVGILQSRSIADGVIRRENLAAVYKTKTAVDTRKRLDAHTKIAAGKDGLITIAVHETLFELLLKQDQIARLDEGKAAQIIQVIDRGAPPDERSGPPRLLIVIGALILGLLAGCGYVLVLESWRRLRQHPALAAKLDLLGHSVTKA